MKLHEHFLRHILGIGVLSGESQCDAEHTVLMHEDQPAERIPVASLGALQDERFVRGGEPGRCRRSCQLRFHIRYTPQTGTAGAIRPRMSAMICGSSMLAMIPSLPPQRAQPSISTPNTR